MNFAIGAQNITNEIFLNNTTPNNKKTTNTNNIVLYNFRDYQLTFNERRQYNFLLSRI